MRLTKDVYPQISVQVQTQSINHFISQINDSIVTLLRNRESGSNKDYIKSRQGERWPISLSPFDEDT